VQSLVLLNNGVPLKALPTAQSPLPVTLTLSSVPFDGGIPALLTLSAKLTCTDGASKTSAPVAATFFPATSVYANADGSPILPNNFYAEGSGTSVTFVGCALDANNAQELVRVDLTGAITQANDSLGSIPCDNSTYFTPRAHDGSRWMVT